MKTPRESFIVNRLKSVKYAFSGAKVLVKSELSIKLQLGITLILCVLGGILNISPIEWVLQLLAIGLVMGLEGMNTAVEKLADFVHPKHHEHIGTIKDVAAGAVFIAAAFATAIGLIIYIPKLF